MDALLASAYAVALADAVRWMSVSDFWMVMTASAIRPLISLDVCMLTGSDSMGGGAGGTCGGRRVGGMGGGFGVTLQHPLEGRSGTGDSLIADKTKLRCTSAVLHAVAAEITWTVAAAAAEDIDSLCASAIALNNRPVSTQCSTSNV